MPEKDLDDKIKKNLLDLQYNRYLQYYNTSIIIMFTYLIAVAIGFITKQIDYKNLNQTLLVGLISIAVISGIIMRLITLKDHLKNIPLEIKKLKL